jgi:hypothetical protein
MEPLFTEEQLEGIKTLVSGIVNSAISARDKMSDKKRGEDRDAILKAIDEKLQTFKPAAPDPEEKGAKGGKRSKEDDLELTALRKSMDELRLQNEQERARAARERSKNIDNSVRQSIYEALSEHGLDAVRSKAAFASFKLDGRFEAQHDEDSDEVTVLFRDDDGTQVPLRDGIKRWVKTDAAKIYLPPTGAKGSGSRPSTGPNGQPIKATPEQVRKNLAEALEKAFD